MRTSDLGPGFWVLVPEPQSSPRQSRSYFVLVMVIPTRRSRNPLIDSIWNSLVQPVVHRSAQRLRHVHYPPVGNVEVPRAAASGAKAHSPRLTPGAQPLCLGGLNARPGSKGQPSPRVRQRLTRSRDMRCRYRDGMVSRRRDIEAAGPSRRSLPRLSQNPVFRLVVTQGTAGASKSCKYLYNE